MADDPGTWARFKIAIAFLTRLPVPLRDDDARLSLADAADLFPLVGVLVGAVGAGVFTLASLCHLGSLPAGILTLAAMVMITGGLHEDGMADVADGFGGGASRERKLAIMRDSRIGTYGVLVLVLALQARLSAVAGLWQPAAVAQLLIAGSACSRAVMAVVMILLPRARRDGLATLAGTPSLARTALGLVLALLLTGVLLPPREALAAILATAATTAAIALLARQQIGGYTGDVLGAVQQAGETAFMLAVLAVVSAPSG
ncbi:adenosylcobinamide-GDP ribazoletransferase [Marinivivus vitaminiproducens]|uniref:adenosylcobinamide-GDP ribazoletransferase n=1 Tax=Marinivivus vitaminiproducens TaxID=3035935 RepID=UPI00279C49F7|nr:adenosylcobinamide-GDP ribazoletransferase [Geminicoccaceae bacterium SCSIO 64248]